MAETFRGPVRFVDENGRNKVYLQSNQFGHIRLYDSDGKDVLSLDGRQAMLWIGKKGHEGGIVIYDRNGKPVFQFEGSRSRLSVGQRGHAGVISVRNSATGKETVWLDGNTGDIRLSGADCAEEFTIPNSSQAEPGTVLVVQEEDFLLPCSQAYDRKVAGVVSGAGNFGPGIILDKKKAQRNRKPVALIGKVYCKVDAGFSRITVGDLLTTSPTKGHAMRATDPTKAFGAVLGKALSSLSKGRGLIPILVALQ